MNSMVSPWPFSHKILIVFLSIFNHGLTNQGNRGMNFPSGNQGFPHLDLFSLLEEKGFSPREMEVLEWAARGKTNIQIGLILDISPRTVTKHLGNIYMKLGVESRTEAVVHLIQTIQTRLQVQVPDPRDTTN